MLTRRNWALRLSIVLNVAVLLYVATHIASRSDLLVEMQDSGRSFASIDVLQQQRLQQQNSAEGFAPQSAVPEAAPSVINTDDGGSKPPDAQSQPSVIVTASATKKSFANSTRDASTTSESSPSVISVDQQTAARTDQAVSDKYDRGLEEVILCHDRPQEHRTQQRGDFWVMYNYVIAQKQFRCFESITYTTHADYTFLDNLEPLLDRWQGPVSLAMHAPGTDFGPTLDAIRYARDCLSPLIAEYVTFHVFFGSRHIPKQVPKPSEALKEHANCSNPPPWTNVTSSMLYKSKSKILYPVNIGRNIARESAPTHYIFPSDIELYPSPGLIKDFLEMVRRQDPPLRHPNPKVFPLAIFELQAGSDLPANKTHLVSMLKNGSAIPFHKTLCPGCHNVPKAKEWTEAKETDGLHVFHTGKRTGRFVHWEPIFIGTHDDPLYDERLSWEGKSDKMTQGYVLCVLDYEFQILDNAFLVHKPGIKTLKKDPQRAMLSSKTNALIKKVIFPELKVLFGTRKGCAI